MTSDLVSVIVPIYNVEKYLDRCISSIVNQSYKNLEIILVDDGSPDRCPQMCEDWGLRDGRIKVIHKENAGLGMARNTGIENASGDFICFFDSDDYVLPRTIEQALILAKETTAEIVVFGMQNVDRNGLITRQLIPQSDKQFFTGTSVRTEFLPALVDGRHRDVTVKNLCFSAWSCIFSMDLVSRTGWRFVSERENISEDSYSLIWLYQYVRSVAILPEICYCHCENGVSLTRTYREDRYQRICQFYQDCMELVELADFGEAVQKSVSGLFVSLVIAAMKQIAVANIKTGQKKKLIQKILHDDMMHRCLQDISGRVYGRSRQVLFWTLRNKCVDFCYVLLVAQNRIRK